MDDQILRRQTQAATLKAIKAVGGNPKDLADKIPFHYRTVWRYKEGRRVGEPEVVKEISIATGIHPSEFRPDIWPCSEWEQSDFS